MTEKTYIVYKHTSPSGKSYIGITSRTLEKRSCSQGQGYKKSPYFSKAIAKYGWENFTHEILFEGLTADEAYAKEKEMIAKFNTRNPDYGYNKSDGGESGSKGAKFSEETRKKMSEAHKGKPSPPHKVREKGWHHTEETKRKLSEMKKGKTWSDEQRKKMEEYASVNGWGFEKNPSKGRPKGWHHTDEARKKMSLVQQNRPLSEKQKAHLEKLHKMDLMHTNAGILEFRNRTSNEEYRKTHTPRPHKMKYYE